MNECLACGKDTKNKEFCSGKCRKMFNEFHHDCTGLKRSCRGLRA